MKVVIIVSVIVIIAIVIAAIYLYLPTSTSLEQKCTSSGGTVKTQLCCNMTGDFPNLCLIGACGCSPDNSHEVKVCECGEGKCWDSDKAQCI